MEKWQPEPAQEQLTVELVAVHPALVMTIAAHVPVPPLSSSAGLPGLINFPGK